MPFAVVADPEPSTRLVLFQALPEKERFELVLQKAVELGVDAIVPFVCRHSTSLAERDAGQRKSHRWPDVILRAARQCRRRILPELYPVLEWEQVLSLAAELSRTYFCHPTPGARPLVQALGENIGASLGLVVGPEGGFAGDEAAAATASGLRPVFLGPRMLRTETAAIASLSLMAALVLDDPPRVEG